MLVDWRGVAIAIAVLTVVVVLGAIDLSCTSDRGPAVLDRVKSEAQSGRQEFATLRREQVAEQLRDMRILNKRLVEQGELKRSRELIRLIVELERQYQRLDAQSKAKEQ